MTTRFLSLLLPLYLLCGNPTTVPSLELDKQETALAIAEQAKRLGITEAEAMSSLETLRVDDPQRYTLTLFYLLTGGDQWKCQRGQRNWLTPKNLEEWEGLTVDETGNVTKLVRSWCNIKGPFPHSLFSLVQLNELVLLGNKLTGTIPSIIGNLKHLRKLGLGGNELTGRLPVSELRKLPELETLLVHNNHFDLPEGVTNDRWGGGLWIRNDRGAVQELVKKLDSSKQLSTRHEHLKIN